MNERTVECIDLADFDDAFAEADCEPADDADLLPDGRYRVVVEKAELEVSRADNKMLVWQMRVLGPRYAGRKLWHRNLDSDFNSLDAQRESAEDYIRAQQHEGWVALSERYDDGAYSGATLERPALRRLMDDVRSGRVDSIVVYKIDRLSRSLLDFARLIEELGRAEDALREIVGTGLPVI